MPILSLLLLLVSLFISSFFAYAEDVIIGATAYDISKYEEWLANKPCYEINDYQHKYANRSTLQLLIICKALHYGGLNANIIFKPLPNYSRSIIEAQKGQIAILGDTLWQNDITQESFYFSEPFFEAGQFQKAFFALPSVRDEIELKIAENKLKNISALETLRHYIAISSKNWRNDWAILKQLQMPVIDSSKSINMCHMIAHQRGDLYLGEIVMNADNEMSLDCGETILKPVRGIKITFNESRHFIVSKNFSNSYHIFKALEAGLYHLKNKGEFERALNPIKENEEKIKGWESVFVTQ